ncbi:MAG: type transport system permease protein [Microbacteriaceae bacterium]|nr:type transport system permease protein [Microbacteriaceae bacterium]
MTTATSTSPTSLAELRPARAAAISAFGSMLLRDLRVLRKDVRIFIVRTLMQPLLLLFVFTYVFPKIGQSIGGRGEGQAAFSTLLVAGVIATAMIFQGIQAVALPLVREFGYTREIEDRVMAPLPVWAVATEKIAAGALQAILAGLIVFPLAKLVPATDVHLTIRWATLIPITILSALTGASLGLFLGTKFEPNQVPLMFSIIVIPMTFLGATYYPWARLTPIKWLKVVVLLNPLVYMSEGFRMALTPIPHMNSVAIFAALIGFTLVLSWLGITGFKRRVLA